MYFQRFTFLCTVELWTTLFREEKCPKATHELQTQCTNMQCTCARAKRAPGTDKTPKKQCTDPPIMQCRNQSWSLLK
jgi:hypothetical protein